MGDFKQDGERSFGGGHGGGFGRRDGGRPSFPRKSWGGSGGRDRGPVTMHQAVCDQCGKPCEVPFRPTAGKPVYCDACFVGKRKASDSRGGDRFPRKDFNSYKTFTKTNTESDVNKGNNDELKKQLEMLNVKMDQLIRTVEVMTNTKPLTVKEKVKKGLDDIDIDTQ
ncbi:MAG: CxxC-x17-CxxC domain-containing protein [Candidatus Paceibacterota bacterium]|jgi:hypothetical protein